MRWIFILLTILFNINTYSQRQDVARDSLSIAEFKVSYDTTQMQDFKVVLITFRPLSASIAQYIGTKVWVQRISDGKKTEKYLGDIETERGIYRPNPQRLNDTFIIVECGEYEGQINLITKNGNFVTIPGYYYALNKPRLVYTRQSNLDTVVYRYDLKSKQGKDLRGKSMKIDDLLFDEVDGAYWIK